MILKGKAAEIEKEVRNMMALKDNKYMVQVLDMVQSKSDTIIFMEEANGGDL